MLSYQQSRVDVSEQIFLVPFQTIGVEGVAVIGSPYVVLPIGLVEGINSRDRAPMLHSREQVIGARTGVHLTKADVTLSLPVG